MEINGTIENKKVAGQGQNNKGKWVRYLFEIDGKPYSTFDEKIYNGFNVGDAVKMTGKEIKGFFNMESMEKAIKTEKIAAPADYHLTIESQRLGALDMALKHFSIIKMQPDDSQVIERANFFLKYIKDGNSENKTSKD